MVKPVLKGKAKKFTPRTGKRKAERKRQRMEKKQKKAHYYLAKKGKGKEEEGVVEQKEEERLPLEDHNQREEEESLESKREREERTRMQMEAKAEKERRKGLKRQRIAIEKEEAVIKQMERKLKLNKRRKKNTLPKSFYEDGLGDLLDFVDKREPQAPDGEDDHDMGLSLKPTEDSEDDMDNDFDSIAMKTDNESIDNEEEEGGVEDEEDEEGGEEEDDESIEGQNESEEEEEVDGKAKKAGKHWEDIYGRVRDKKGNVVEPEKLRDKTEDAVGYEPQPLDVQLVRRLRGQLNRVTTSNLPSISSLIGDLYKTHSFRQMNDSICKCINDLVLIEGTLSPLKLVLELALLVAVLHENVGEEIGAHVVHIFVVKFSTLLQSKAKIDEESKELDNVVAFLVHLYACNLVDPLLVFDLIDELCGVFNEKCIELIVFVLRTVGFLLRKDSALKMKELVLNVNKLASGVNKEALVGGNRVAFMLETLTAIKNNNVMKVTSNSSFVNPIETPEIRNILKNCLKISTKVNYIPGRLKEVSLSNRWWIKRGTLIEDVDQDIEGRREANRNANLPQGSDAATDLIDGRLCRLLRLNTPLRKLLFNALITASDYVEASERLARIGKKQVAEVVNVVMHVSLHEKTFNPFYVHLLKRLAAFDRKYKIALQFAIRDKLTDFATIGSKQRTILAESVFLLLKLNVIPITVLKVIEFSELNEAYVEFLRSVLTKIFNEEEEVIGEVLSKIPRKDSFATAIRLFINCFIDKNLAEKVDIIKAQLKMYV